LLFGEPGDLQVRPLLQPPTGGRGDRAGFEELGRLGVLRGDEIALQIPLGYGALSGGGGPPDLAASEMADTGR
jgi:hypothetical protein